MSLRSAAAFVAVPGVSFTSRMNCRCLATNGLDPAALRHERSPVYDENVMQEVAGVGYTRWVQVVASAFLFGTDHIRLLRDGIMAGLLAILPTAILGALYAVIYSFGRRSLMAMILSHFLNDAAVIPWIFLAVARRLGR
jgi:CAAX prenyl protease-like protein